MIQAYVTALESQAHLSTKADWLALTEPQQDDFLSWGRVYIDSEFLCAYDETDATDDIKLANSLLGYLAMTDVLFKDAPKVKSVAVKAGSVESDKTYSAGYTEEHSLHKQASLLLMSDCSKTSGQTYLFRA